MTLRTFLRPIARVVPVGTRTRVVLALQRVQEPIVRRAFERATAGEPLGIDALRALCEEFPVRPRDYGRTPDDYLRRGEDRLREVGAFVAPPARVLEIGGGDGMACRAMQLAGYETVLTDITVDEIDPRARASGVELVRGDATTLPFASSAFDCVFSFNAFEHLPHPDATFAEMRRVLRPGGLGFISFSALGYSPEGPHLTRLTGVPYVNVLFAPETFESYRRERGLDGWVPPINGWPVERFRALFHGARDTETLRYEEERNLYFLGLISRFLPQAKRAPSWDSLVVEGIRFVFRKRRS
jgi:SAM-dependent methyltransferase